MGYFFQNFAYISVILHCRVGAGVDDIWSDPSRGGDGGTKTDGWLCRQHYICTLPVSKPTGLLCSPVYICKIKKKYEMHYLL